MKGETCPLCFKRTANLYESVDVVHKSLGSADDELVHTGDGVGPAGMMKRV